jgi:uncharacterized protein
MFPIELLITLVFVGTAAGIAAGLFGVGGGIVTVPSLLFLTTASFREAVAASLLVIALTTPVALFHHHRAGNVRWRMGLLLGASGVAGVAAATWVGTYLSDRVLEWAFAGFLLVAAQRLAYGAPVPLRAPGTATVLVLGFGAGIIAKLLGVGGGLLVVPALALAGFDIHLAVATSLVSVFTNAVVSTGANLALGVPGAWAAWSVPLSAAPWA